MDASALASAESGLSAIAVAKLIAAFLVAAGVAIQFGGDWVARPYERIVKEAREAELAALNNDTARLYAETETAKREIVTANTIAAKANERAAILEKEAAEVRLEQEQLKSHLAWRRINEKQFQIIVRSLAGVKFDIHIKSMAGDPEASLFAIDIQNVLSAAGFKKIPIMSGTFSRPDPYIGVIIFGPRNDIDRISTSFIHAGLNIQTIERPGDSIELIVGHKPPIPPQ